MRNNWLIFGLLSALFTSKGIEALRCYKCNSDTNENCATLVNMGSLVAADCENINDSCQLIIGKNGNTIRGCSQEVSSEIPDALQHFACNSGDLCNGEIYPANRPQCHICSGPDCVAQRVGEPTAVCPIFDPNDECYLIVDHLTSARRGCLSSLTVAETQFCATNEGRCITCSEEGCNSMAGTAPSTLRCVVCDSTTTSFCSLDQLPLDPALNRVCQVSLLGHQPACYSSSQDGIVRRGCTAERLPEQITACESGAARCESCSTGNNCNVSPIEGDYCYTCTSASDPNCASQVSSAMYGACPVSADGVTGCYRRENGATVSRGCASQLTQPLLQECRDGITCKICRGFGCNRKVDFQSCYLCDSVDDVNCVHLTDIGRIDTTVCKEYLDTCRTWIRSGTQSTARGCFLETEDVACFSSTVTCDECEENFCNGFVFPVARPRCNQCSGQACSDVATDSPFLLPCRRYVFQPECFSILHDTEVVHRGCMIDEAMPGTELCRADPTRCVVCTSTGCNIDPIATPPTISCQDCGPSVICGWSQAQENPKVCTTPIPLGSRETCFTQIQNGLATRGCTDMAIDNSCTNNPASCTRCTGSNCNRQNAFVQSCIKCRSTVTGQESCSETAFGLAPEECFQPFQQFEERGCYTRNDNGVIVRGCITDLVDEDQEKCRGVDYEACQFCIDNGCNVQQAPDSATSTKLSVVLLLASLLVIYWQK